MKAPPELSALLLIGGKSTRMGRDKAGIEWDDGQTLLQRSLSLLGSLDIKTYLSIAADDTRNHPAPVIRDLEPDLGPLCALHSAFAAHPASAWLVIACDMPNLSAETLRLLLSERDPGKDATCFLNPIDGKPEPLCAIYEPSSAAAAATAVQEKRLCARRLLSRLDRTDLTPPSPGALDNCNRPEHLAELTRRQHGPATEKKVTVEYFASLRDPAGTSREVVTTSAHTAAGLWDELRLRHGFHLDLDAVRLARNDEFAPWTCELQPGDHLALLPPFAGG